jgi:regulator of replication initiation timing
LSSEKKPNGKAVLYDRLLKLEGITKNTLEEIQVLKAEFDDIVKENNALMIENENLRARLDELNQTEKEQTENSDGEVMSVSRRNLEKLYEDGFHVCNLFYGSRRVEDEACAFCLEVIYGER